MDKPEIVETNTCGYIKIDKFFINDINNLKKDYLQIKEKIKNEILKENNIVPKQKQ